VRGNNTANRPANSQGDCYEHRTGQKTVLEIEQGAIRTDLWTVGVSST